MELYVAALLTCFNRVAKTLECIGRLYEQPLPPGAKLEVFLVDDGSSDGTGEQVKAAFPAVNVIQGTGSLFWAGGMRLAWESAAKSRDFDFYMWLNDDTILRPDALLKLFDDYNEAVVQYGRAGVLVAEVCDPDSGVFTYGGHSESAALEPNGTIQACAYCNGNLVLIPRQVYCEQGGMSEKFTHGIGDYEYGVRTRRSDFGLWCTREYLAECSFNPFNSWCDPERPMLTRLKMLYHPRGLNIKEYMAFRREYFGDAWRTFCISHFRAIAPRTFERLRRLRKR